MDLWECIIHDKYNILSSLVSFDKEASGKTVMKKVVQN
jgi:hypothetical protein